MASERVLNSNELLTRIYGSIGNWNDKLSFSCVNSTFHSIAFNTLTSDVYHIKQEEDLLKSLPATTAKTVRLNLNSESREAVLDRLFKTFSKTNKVILSNDMDLNIQVIEKLCKTAAKQGVSIEVEKSSRKKIFEDMMKKYEEKFRDQYYMYEENKGRSKKRLPCDVELMEVPVDRKKRQIFFLNKSLELAMTDEAKPRKKESHVQEPFLAVIRSDINYEHVNRLNVNTQPMLADNHSVVLDQAKRFINCIIEFDNHSILITSFDLLWHNQPNHDDSAFGLDKSDFYNQPTCKVKRKTAKNKSFKEISIYFGMNELLMVGGYIYINDNLIPSLGSSLGNIDLPDESSSDIFIPITQQPYMNTERLLDQYFKDCSYKLWVYEAFNYHHFASELLYTLCNKKAITNDTMSELWLSFTRTNVYYGITNGVFVRNFKEMKTHLDGQEARNVYVKLLVKIAEEMERKCPNYAVGIFGLDEGRKNAMDIMKIGLKDTIKKQNDINAKNRKINLKL